MYINANLSSDIHKTFGFDRVNLTLSGRAVQKASKHFKIFVATLICRRKHVKTTVLTLVNVNSTPGTTQVKF